MPAVTLAIARSRLWLVVAILGLGACTASSPSAPESRTLPSVVETPSLQPTPTSEASVSPSIEPFPDPISGQAVYDEAGVLSASVEASLEVQIDAIETRSGAELVVYLQVDPEATEESNLAAARALMDQWGVGRAGINDGLVILVSFEEDLLHGTLSTFAGPGLLGSFPIAEQDRLRNEVMIPAFGAGDIEEGIVLGVNFVDEALP